jgi:hypothetical protein
MDGLVWEYTQMSKREGSNLQLSGGNNVAAVKFILGPTSYTDFTNFRYVSASLWLELKKVQNERSPKLEMLLCRLRTRSVAESVVRPLPGIRRPLTPHSLSFGSTQLNSTTDHGASQKNVFFHPNLISLCLEKSSL